MLFKWSVFPVLFLLVMLTTESSAGRKTIQKKKIEKIKMKIHQEKWRSNGRKKREELSSKVTNKRDTQKLENAKKIKTGEKLTDSRSPSRSIRNLNEKSSGKEKANTKYTGGNAWRFKRNWHKAAENKLINAKTKGYLPSKLHGNSNIMNARQKRDDRLELAKRDKRNSYLVEHENLAEKNDNKNIATTGRVSSDGMRMNNDNNYSSKSLKIGENKLLNEHNGKMMKVSLHQESARVNREEHKNKQLQTVSRPTTEQHRSKENRERTIPSRIARDVLKVKTIKDLQQRPLRIEQENLKLKSIESPQYEPSRKRREYIANLAEDRTSKAQSSIRPVREEQQTMSRPTREEHQTMSRPTREEHQTMSRPTREEHQTMSRPTREEHQTMSQPTREDHPGTLHQTETGITGEAHRMKSTIQETPHRISRENNKGTLKKQAMPLRMTREQHQILYRMTREQHQLPSNGNMQKNHLASKLPKIFM